MTSTMVPRPCAGGSDVEENHFVRALFIVAQREFHRITHITQAAALGHAELDAAGDVAVVDIEAGNDTFCNHIYIETSLAAQGKRQFADADFP